jgi:hypothetical protein
MAQGKCVYCGDMMVSTHVHDFVECSCGESFLDGGDEYFRATLSTVPLDENGNIVEEFMTEKMWKLLAEHGNKHVL